MNKKRTLLTLVLALLLAVPALAQDATTEPALVETAAVTAEATQPAESVGVVINVEASDNPAPVDTDVQIVYVEVMPAWVLPGFALCFAAMAFMLFIIWRQGGKLAEMVSEKGMQGLIKIALDFARDLANKTTTPIDNALIDIVAGEVKPAAPAQPGSVSATG